MSYNKNSKTNREICVVDLFCGVGGLTHGFIKEKFNVVAGLDWDNSCKYAYETNNAGAKFLHKNLRHTKSKTISSLFPKKSIRILVGCAPCQAFSTLTQKYKENDKWKLLYSFGRIIRETRPHIVSMENVPNLLKYQGGKVFNDFLQLLRNQHYTVSYQVINASNYGVPQNRQRLILIASRIGKIKFIEPTHSKRKITVRDAIGHLPPIKDGQTHKNDIIHRARKLSPLNRLRIRATPKGGSWKDWPRRLVLECHKKETGKTFSSVYGRMNWNDIAPTLTTQCTGFGNGRYGHPVQHRAISFREAALLQSFPRSYEFVDPKNEKSNVDLETHIGNAVPVNLGRMIAKSIKKHLKKRKVIR